MSFFVRAWRKKGRCSGSWPAGYRSSISEDNDPHWAAYGFAARSNIPPGFYIEVKNQRTDEVRYFETLHGSIEPTKKPRSRVCGGFAVPARSTRKK